MPGVLVLLAVVLLLIAGCGGDQAAEQATTTSAMGATTILTTTSTLPSVETTTTSEITLPAIPEMFPRTDEAESGWQQQILGSWSRTMEDQSTETVTFKADNTLFFTYGDEPDQIRVGTYICEQGGTLALFTLMYVRPKNQTCSICAKSRSASLRLARSLWI